MTALALAIVMTAAPEGEIRHEVDILGGLIPTDSWVNLASVTASYTLRASEVLGWQIWGGYAGAWNKKLANDLARVAVELGHDEALTFSHPEWLIGANAQWRLPYDDGVESRVHAGPMFMTRRQAEPGERYGVGIFLGGGLRLGLGADIAAIADVGGMVYTVAETPVDMKYLLTLRIGVGFSI